MIIGMTTLSKTPVHCTSVVAASAAPTSPPMRACVEDDGRAKYHVMRFHVMAPTTALKTRTSPSPPVGVAMMPSPTVLATPVATTAPSRLATAAMISATRGVSARVDTAVAMAFAASWKPFV